MFERFGELPDDVDQLKVLALAAFARADGSEAEARANKTDAEAFRSQTSERVNESETAGFGI